MTPLDPVLAGSYDYRLVAVSILIAILASRRALDLGERVTGADGGARLSCLIGGATAMGIGIWSMHYIGVMAFRLPVPVLYDWPTAALSLQAGILASALCLFIVSRRTMGPVRALAGGVIMAAGIAASHYTAMESMRMPAMRHYSPALVVLSVVVAIAISLPSLWLTFLFRGEASRAWRNTASALLMGTAIAVMHFTGMAAASFTRSAVAPDFSHALNMSSLSIVGFGVVILAILEIALLTSLVDRLQKHQILHDELFEQAPQAIVLMNVDNSVVRVNREFTRVFGYTSQETVGLLLPDLIAPVELGEEVQKYTDMVAHGQRVDAEGIRQRKDGARVHVSMARVPFSLPGGQVLVYAIFIDITKRKRAEEELRVLAEEAHRAELLEQTDKFQRALLNTISHNLRTPLASVTGALNSLLEDGSLHDASIQRELLETARAEAGRLNQLIQNLLDMTRLEGGAVRVKMEPCDVQDVIGAALEQLGEAARGRPISIGIEPGLPFVPMDAVLIMQVLVNLLDNALKYSPRDADIEVEAWQSDGQLRIRVADRGKGIPEQDLERVFEKFFRGVAAGAPGGAGLGLSICKGFVEAHSGRIWAARRELGGTEVTFSLPLKQQQ